MFSQTVPKGKSALQTSKPYKADVPYTVPGVAELQLLRADRATLAQLVGTWGAPGMGGSEHAKLKRSLHPLSKPSKP